MTILGSLISISSLPLIAISCYKESYENKSIVDPRVPRSEKSFEDREYKDSKKPNVPDGRHLVKPEELSNEIELVDESEFDHPFDKIDISSWDLGVEGNINEDDLVKKMDRISTSLGIKIQKNKDYSIRIEKATRDSSGRVLIKGFGRKLYGEWKRTIRRLNQNDISDLDLELDYTNKITKEDVAKALDLKIDAFDVEEGKDFSIKIIERWPAVPGKIIINTYGSKTLDGELTIKIPPENVPIDLLNLKLDIGNRITRYTPWDEIFKSFNRAIGFIPKLDRDFRIFTTHNVFAPDTFEGSFSIIAQNSKLFKNHLELKSKRPKSFDIKKIGHVQKQVASIKNY